MGHRCARLGTVDVSFLETEDGTTAFTTGMEAVGLPNVARSIPAGSRLEDVAGAMMGIVREMASQKWHPQNGERFMAEDPFVLRRVHDTVWMHLIAEHDESFDRLARYRFGVGRAVELVLKVEPLGSDSVGRAFRVDHFRGFSTTNGLGLEHGIEIACFTERVGPRTSQMLAAVGDLVGAREIQPYDRVAHARPMCGIAGHVLWPCGHLRPMDDHPPIMLYDALPIFVDELAAFRDDPHAQAAWIAMRNEKRDVHTIHARWNGLFA